MAGRIQTDSDPSVKVSTVLPNAANTTSTNTIDLGSATPFPITERFEVKLSASIATQANSKNINVALQHCADTNVSNFVNIPELSALVVTGNAANVIPATRTVVLPPSTLRYIRATALGEANGGNSADGTLTVSLLF